MNAQEYRNLQEAYLEVVENQQLDEANRVERHLGIHSNTPENELARMRRRSSVSGVGSGKESGISPETLRMNRDVARTVTQRNRGKSPSDPKYTKRRGIDPHADAESWRDSPLGLPKGHKDPLNPRTSKNIGNKVKVKTKPASELFSNPHQASNKISKFRREDYDIYDIILSHLLDEGYADTNESALAIMSNMSEEWRDNILEARVDDGLSDEEKQDARNKRSGGQSDFTRRNLTKAGRGKSPKGLKPVETTPAMTSVRKYEMALNQPNTPVGKRVAGEIAMNDAERGPSGRRGS